jgi:hypothetical protein
MDARLVGGSGAGFDSFIRGQEPHGRLGIPLIVMWRL